MKRYALIDRANSGKAWPQYLAPNFTHAHLGLMTPVTADDGQAWTTGDRALAESLVPKLNRSPFATWEVCELC